MNKQSALMCAAIICLAHVNPILADEATGSNSPTSSSDPVQTDANSSRQSDDSDSSRDKRPTNTEETDRRYQDEEIRNAAPPPVRVRNQPAPAPR